MLKHGFLIVDKPEGITSAKAVAAVKRALKCKKIGHAGTLDPLASGVLPLAIGEATKAISYITDAVKKYSFTVCFGEARATDDREGIVTATTATLPIRAAIERAIPGFIGTIMQTPPIYSALKVDGERAYDLARQGKDVVLAARPVCIHNLTLVDVSMVENGISDATFSVVCGKGTYVRAIARDIALQCNSLGYVSWLRRTAVGKFDECHAISLDKLDEFVHNPPLFGAWVPIESALDDILAINVDPEQARRLRQGQAVACHDAGGNACMVLCQGQIIALAESVGQMLKPLRVFNIN